MSETFPRFGPPEDTLGKIAPDCAGGPGEALHALLLVSWAGSVGKVVPVAHSRTGDDVPVLMSEDLFSRFLLSFGAAAAAGAYRALRAKEPATAARFRDLIFRRPELFCLSLLFEQELTGEEHAILCCDLRSRTGWTFYYWGGATPPDWQESARPLAFRLVTRAELAEAARSMFKGFHAEALAPAPVGLHRIFSVSAGAILTAVAHVSPAGARVDESRPGVCVPFEEV
jgi:hypothetical protein